jgi:hypothetical protein
MAFKTSTRVQSEASDKPKVNWDELNSYVVETAGLQERETLVGVVAGLVDVGIQAQEDAAMPFVGSEEDEAAEIEKNPSTYFKDEYDPVQKKTVRMKCWPQKPVQCVAVAIDFPDIVVDKGQFFGESNPQPLRLWLGGQFYTENTGTVVARPTPLKEVNLEKDRSKKGVWSFSPLHLFYKMAKDAKLIKPGEAFKPQDIDQLLGKAFQFEAQVHFKEHKGKEYYTEYVKYVGALGRGQSAPESENLFMVQFDDENDPEALKQVRSHVINTMKKALNLDTSIVRKELDLEPNGLTVAGYKAAEAPEAPKEEPKVKKTAEKPKKAVAPPPAEDDDGDAPF